MEQVLNQFRSDKKLRDDCIAIYEAMGLDLNTAFRMFMERTRMVVFCISSALMGLTQQRKANGLIDGRRMLVCLMI